MRRPVRIMSSTARLSSTTRRRSTVRFSVCYLESKGGEGAAAVVVISGEEGRGEEGPLCTTNARNRAGGGQNSCCGRGEVPDAGSEGSEDRGDGGASCSGQAVAVRADNFVDQTMGTEQAELATGPGRAAPPEGLARGH